MKTRRTFAFLTILLSLTSLLMTSCDENMTVDVPGPDIEFHFTYSALRGGGDNFLLIAESDTLYGKDVRDYLSKNDQKYDSVVSSATIKNAILTLNEGYNFAGVDSMQIRYRIAGTRTEMVMATAYYTADSPDTLRFSDVKVSKEAAFELISNDVIASLYARFDRNNRDINCFQTGVTYTFKAKTVLAVKMAALANGFSL